MKVVHRVGLVVEDAFNEPGERGIDGRDGIDGKPGVDGRDGESIQGPPGEPGQGLDYRGEWRRTIQYLKGDIVVYDGSSYVCVESSQGKSPPSKRYWGILAAKGEDGLDGVSQRGPRGLPGTTTTVVVGGEPTAMIFDAAASKGMPLYVSGDGHVALADATTLTTATVIGLAAADVSEGFAGLVITNGELELEDWTAVLGSALLSPGVAVYLALGGGLSHDGPEPAAGRCVGYIGRALSETRLLIEVSTPIVLTDPPEE